MDFTWIAHRQEDEKKYTRRLNKESTSKFLEGYLYRQSPEEGQMAEQSKRCDNNDNDLEICPIVNNVPYLPSYNI